MAYVDGPEEADKLHGLHIAKHRGLRNKWRMLSKRASNKWKILSISKIAKDDFKR